MGGDHGPSVTLPACKAFLASHPRAQLILVGTQAALAAASGWPRTSCVVASEVVTMDDPVEVALRRKKGSSMRLAIEQVRDGIPGLAFSAQAVEDATLRVEHQQRDVTVAEIKAADFVAQAKVDPAEVQAN